MGSLHNQGRLSRPVTATALILVALLAVDPTAAQMPTQPLGPARPSQHTPFSAAGASQPAGTFDGRSTTFTPAGSSPVYFPPLSSFQQNDTLYGAASPPRLTAPLAQNASLSPWACNPSSPKVPPSDYPSVPCGTWATCGGPPVSASPLSSNQACYSLHGGQAASCLACQVPLRRWHAGFEFLWMRAHFDQNVAMIIDPPVGNTLRPFDYSYDLTPRAWLGWQSARSGGGFRATYWRFNASAAQEQATAVVGATPVYLFVYGAGGNLTRNAYADLGERLVSNHRLTLHALDLEATQRFSCASLQCVAGVGVRVAEMDQHLRGDIYDATNALWEVVTNDLSFEGAGPTASLQIERSLAHSGWSLFSGLRGALLLSDTRQSIYEMKDAYANEVTDIAEQTEILSMGELSLGLQYARCLGPRADFFVRGTFEGQAWFDIGGPVDSTSTVAFDGIGLTTGLSF